LSKSNKIRSETRSKHIFKRQTRLNWRPLLRKMPKDRHSKKQKRRKEKQPRQRPILRAP